MQKTFRFFRWSGQKAVLALALTVVIAVLTVNVTVAAIVMRTQTIRNKFSPAELEISTWSGNDVINSGDTPVYVRAIVIATWTSDDAEKTVHAFAPDEGVDYEIVTSADWFKASDGFYYYKNVLAPAQTSTLITKATQLRSIEGHTLRVFVISSAIQTAPTDEAVEASWPAIRVAADGTLEEKTA